MIRLTSEFWVQAYMRRLDLENIPAFVTTKGDLTAGSVLIKVNTLDGNAQAFERSFDLQTGQRAWIGVAVGCEAEVDMAIRRQKSFDPDVWVIEVEDKQGRHLLDQPGLE
ncbi:MAG: GTP-binding protein Era [Marinosulfonomonas sp.]|nr:MAG: GTP-binding protein Era [Marinosulfonomonas sp.]